jgi:hypothetical protein
MYFHGPIQTFYKPYRYIVFLCLFPVKACIFFYTNHRIIANFFFIIINMSIQNFYQKNEDDEIRTHDHLIIKTLIPC